MSREFSPARKHPRVPVDILVIRANAPPRLDRVRNLSRRGALVETRAALPVGSHHTFLFIMPGQTARTSVAAVDATVVWAGPSELGLSFQREHEIVDDFIESVSPR